MSVLVVGSVALDSVETPFGKADNVLGGSANFFSASASHLTKVSVVGVIGSDYPVDKLEPLKKRGVDYSGLEQQGVARAKTCPPGNEQCRENASAVIGPGYWKQDERGALAFATLKLLQRDAKVTSYSYDWQDLVEGYFLQLTNNADQSRTFAYIAMHEHKLYIVEGSVPKGSPPPGLFQQSLGWVDKDGRGIRYTSMYSNAFHGMGVYPKPPIVGAPGIPSSTATSTPP